MSVDQNFMMVNNTSSQGDCIIIMIDNVTN